ncbi:putative NRDE-2, necessary for RNA interference [Monocercomonoides exilis]|uniref:putative NRDE-2, necessary for RNA interference n=1 Tax=Monocercomonoides exilis TaxID=2049356 RepID=UPI00355A759C|nr:putative NRDE-2, necessary for RNA interference [Monocercomonoides exilis]|eukprot:MONOS_563.1-p1 / transcript=MONOS_563.1 / gene=MONOS_563 / organism=Monocercomonoides_exilis_PA203 / gene_product=unspecified product / transcript_product=unspecified product / location=Mono_scaffold00009:50238-56155(-) / protein_length=1938 / sequence_SO=supercontig / SO=protein_coding / is_pseudo=false
MEKYKQKITIQKKEESSTNKENEDENLSDSKFQNDLIPEKRKRSECQSEHENISESVHQKAKDSQRRNHHHHKHLKDRHSHIHEHKKRFHSRRNSVDSNHDKSHSRDKSSLSRSSSPFIKTIEKKSSNTSATYKNQQEKYEESPTFYNWHNIPRLEKEIKFRHSRYQKNQEGVQVRSRSMIITPTADSMTRPLFIIDKSQDLTNAIIFEPPAEDVPKYNRPSFCKLIGTDVSWSNWEKIIKTTEYSNRNASFRLLQKQREKIEKKERKRGIRNKQISNLFESTIPSHVFHSRQLNASEKSKQQLVCGWEWLVTQTDQKSGDDNESVLFDSFIPLQQSSLFGALSKENAKEMASAALFPQSNRSVASSESQDMLKMPPAMEIAAFYSRMTTKHPHTAKWWIKLANIQEAQMTGQLPKTQKLFSNAEKSSNSVFSSTASIPSIAVLQQKLSILLEGMEHNKSSQALSLEYLRLLSSASSVFTQTTSAASSSLSALERERLEASCSGLGFVFGEWERIIGETLQLKKEELEESSEDESEICSEEDEKEEDEIFFDRRSNVKEKKESYSRNDIENKSSKQISYPFETTFKKRTIRSVQKAEKLKQKTVADKLFVLLTGYIQNFLGSFTTFSMKSLQNTFSRLIHLITDQKPRPSEITQSTLLSLSFHLFICFCLINAHAGYKEVAFALLHAQLSVLMASSIFLFENASDQKSSRWMDSLLESVYERKRKEAEEDDEEPEELTEEERKRGPFGWSWTGVKERIRNWIVDEESILGEDEIGNMFWERVKRTKPSKGKNGEGKAFTPFKKTTLDEQNINTILKQLPSTISSSIKSIPQLLWAMSERIVSQTASFPLRISENVQLIDRRPDRFVLFSDVEPYLIDPFFTYHKSSSLSSLELRALLQDFFIQIGQLLLVHFHLLSIDLSSFSESFMDHFHTNNPYFIHLSSFISPFHSKKASSSSLHFAITLLSQIRDLLSKHCNVSSQSSIHQMLMKDVITSFSNQLAQWIILLHSQQLKASDSNAIITQSTDSNSTSVVPKNKSLASQLKQFAQPFFAEFSQDPFLWQCFICSLIDVGGWKLATKTTATILHSVFSSQPVLSEEPLKHNSFITVATHSVLSILSSEDISSESAVEETVNIMKLCWENMKTEQEKQTATEFQHKSSYAVTLVNSSISSSESLGISSLMKSSHFVFFKECLRIVLKDAAVLEEEALSKCIQIAEKWAPDRWSDDLILSSFDEETASSSSSSDLKSTSSLHSQESKANQTGISSFLEAIIPTAQQMSAFLLSSQLCWTTSLLLFLSPLQLSSSSNTLISSHIELLDELHRFFINVCSYFIYLSFIMSQLFTSRKVLSMKQITVLLNLLPRPSSMLISFMRSSHVYSDLPLSLPASNTISIDPSEEEHAKSNLLSSCFAHCESELITSHFCVVFHLSFTKPNSQIQAKLQTSKNSEKDDNSSRLSIVYPLPHPGFFDAFNLPLDFGLEALEIGRWLSSFEQHLTFLSTLCDSILFRISSLFLKKEKAKKSTTQMWVNRFSFQDLRELKQVNLNVLLHSLESFPRNTELLNLLANLHRKVPLPAAFSSQITFLSDERIFFDRAAQRPNNPFAVIAGFQHCLPLSLQSSLQSSLQGSFATSSSLASNDSLKLSRAQIERVRSLLSSSIQSETSIVNPFIWLLYVLLHSISPISESSHKSSFESPLRMSIVLKAVRSCAWSKDIFTQTLLGCECSLSSFFPLPSCTHFRDCGCECAGLCHKECGCGCSGSVIGNLLWELQDRKRKAQTDDFDEMVAERHRTEKVRSHLSWSANLMMIPQEKHLCSRLDMKDAIEIASSNEIDGETEESEEEEIKSGLDEDVISSSEGSASDKREETDESEENEDISANKADNEDKSEKEAKDKEDEEEELLFNESDSASSSTDNEVFDSTMRTNSSDVWGNFHFTSFHKFF